MPDRPFILDQAAKLFARMVQEHMNGEAKKQFELSQHTPNLIEAGKIFQSVSRAILSSEQIGSSVEIKKLSDKLRSQAVIKSDWPLKIVASTRAEAEANPIEATLQIDCPEYLLYQAYQGGHWELEKVPNLKAAQSIITKSGYNIKKTANIIVLHNLNPISFTLFEETEEGLVQISREEAIGKKKLMLSWEK